MDKWFEDKMSRRNLRKVSRGRLDTPYNNLKRNLEGIFRKFSITTWIILVNVIVFIFAMVFAGVYGLEKVVQWIALQPNLFFQGQVWQLITSMFMHGGLGHLFVNMISLFFLGGFVERLIGRKRYFWFYMLSGIAAGLLFVGLAYFFGGSDIGMRFFGSPETFAVGASGAIFGLGGLLALLTPNLRVYVLFFIPMKMWQGIVFLLAVLWLASFSLSLPVGNTAHLGGLLVGLGYGIYLKKKYKRKTKMINKYFSG